MSRSIVLALTLIAFAGGCDKKAPDKAGAGGSTAAGHAAAGSAAAAPATAATPGEAWQEHAGPGFTQRGPRAPTKKTTDVPTAIGTMAMTAYSYGQPGADRAYMVMVTDFGDKIEGADMAKLLIDAREGMVNRYGAKLDANTDITIGDTPAIDFAAHGDHAQLGKFALRARAAVKDNTLYQIMALGPGHAQLADAGAFVEGFAFAR